MITLLSAGDLLKNGDCHMLRVLLQQSLRMPKTFPCNRCFTPSPENKTTAVTKYRKINEYSETELLIKLHVTRLKFIEGRRQFREHQRNFMKMSGNEHLISFHETAVEHLKIRSIPIKDPKYNFYNIKNYENNALRLLFGEREYIRFSKDEKALVDTFVRFVNRNYATYFPNCYIKEHPIFDNFTLRDVEDLFKSFSESR